MELVEFEYNKNWPVIFDHAFFSYMNENIGGELKFVCEGDVIMPFIYKRKLFLNIAYCIHGPRKNGKTLGLTDEKEFFNRLRVYFKNEFEVDFMLPPLHVDIFSTDIEGVEESTPLGIITLDLEGKSEDELFSGFKSQYRGRIRKAVKDGIIVKEGKDCFDHFYELYKSKLTSERAPIDQYSQVKRLFDSLIEQSQSDCFVAYKEGKPEAALLNIHDKENAYYFLAGTAVRAHPGALRMIQWEVIKKYSTLGLKKYHLGGARLGDNVDKKYKELLAFKKGFGSEVNEGKHFVLVVNKLKYKFYKSLLSIREKA